MSVRAGSRSRRRLERSSTPSHDDLEAFARSQKSDAREYRREHHLCFYCGAKDHGLKDCQIAPHNRDGFLRPVSRGTSPSTLVPSPMSARSVSGNRTPVGSPTPTRSERPEPGRLARLGLLGEPPIELSDSQWSIVYNAYATAEDETDYHQLSLAQTVSTLQRYLQVLFSDAPAARSASPSVKLDPGVRGEIAVIARSWEVLPKDVKSRAIEAYKQEKADEPELMRSLDVVGDKIWKEGSLEMKKQFEEIVKLCMPDMR